MKQLGVIVFGEGVDKDQKISEAKARGYEVKVFNDRAELWADPKKFYRQLETSGEK